MKFYFDDSGSFSVTLPAPHVILGVLIPDNREVGFIAFHKEFVASLKPEEFKNGEPKGSKLTDAARGRLFDYLARNPWVRIAISVSDSEFNDQKQVQGYRQEQVALYEADFLAGRDKHVNAATRQLQLDLLTMIKYGISDVQFVKGLLLFHTVQVLLHDSIQYFQSSDFDGSWHDFLLVFDRQDKDTITTMEAWVSREFMHFIQEHSEPFVVPESWIGRKHPFLTRFKDKHTNRLVLNDIFKDGFSFQDSSLPGLQYADWIANTVRQVLHRRRDAIYLDIIRPNLVGFKRTRLNLARIYKADWFGIRDKYKNLLY